MHRQLLATAHFPSCSSQLQHIRCLVRRVLLEQQCPVESATHIVLAVNEACMNIMQHAYGCADAGEIILEIFNNRGTLIFRLTDFAEPTDRACLEPRDVSIVRPGGLGVHFIREIMDEVTFLDTENLKAEEKTKGRAGERVGNILEMKINLEKN